jgi:enoyl-CoA hydratase
VVGAVAHAERGGDQRRTGDHDAGGEPLVVVVAEPQHEPAVARPAVDVDITEVDIVDDLAVLGLDLRRNFGDGRRRDGVEHLAGEHEEAVTEIPRVLHVQSVEVIIDEGHGRWTHRGDGRVTCVSLLLRGKKAAGGERSPVGSVRLEVEGAIATITNDNPEKHNAFDDDMDVQLFDILGELKGRTDIRAVIWQGEGKSFSSGRDVGSIGTLKVPLSHHELMRRGHRGIQQLWDIDAPIIVACKGWVMGGSFQRALLCDIRVAAVGTRFRLPETTHGVIPDTGGVGVLYEMCGHGVVSDLVLTGRVMPADEALAHGVVSRVVPEGELDTTVREIAEQIAKAPTLTIKLAREVIRQLAVPAVRSSMRDEMIYQTFLNRSDDAAELRASRAEGREPRYTGS